MGPGHSWPRLFCINKLACAMKGFLGKRRAFTRHQVAEFFVGVIKTPRIIGVKYKSTYPFIRLFIGVITLLITGDGLMLLEENIGEVFS